MIKEITEKGYLEFAVATEDVGVMFYNRLAEQFSNDNELSNLFESLGKDELAHRQQFSELLNLAREETPISGSPEKSDYLRAMSISEFFSHHHGPFADVDKIEGREDAMEKALGLEKATLGFYHAVQDLIGTNPILDQIIEAEKSHITRLIKSIVTGDKFRSLQDKWP